MKRKGKENKEVIFYTRATWAILIGGFCMTVAVVLLAKALVNSW